MQLTVVGIVVKAAHTLWSSEAKYSQRRPRQQNIFLLLSINRYIFRNYRCMQTGTIENLGESYACNPLS